MHGCHDQVFFAEMDKIAQNSKRHVSLSKFHFQTWFPIGHAGAMLNTLAIEYIVA